MKSILFTFTILFFVTACQKEKPNLEEPDIQSLRAKTKPTEVVVGQVEKMSLNYTLIAMALSKLNLI